MVHTLQISVEDNFLQEFLEIIDKYNGKIKIEKDKNLLLDPFFYERQKQLQQEIEDIDSGKVKMLSKEEYDKEINSFLVKLRLNMKINRSIQI